MLEADNYMRILGRGSNWFRYVDDILGIIPENTNIENKLRMLNNVNSNIQFTVEKEENNKLPFLDTIIHKTHEGIKFSVYRKPTNKDDFIHYLSGHDKKVKTGVVIGFFLRALRVCSPEYLEEEFTYIKNAFQKLKYPISLLNSLLNKSKNIYNRIREEQEPKNSNYLSVPMSTISEAIDKYLSNAGINIVKSSGIKIGEMVKKSEKIKTNDNSIIYRIPCAGCSASYIGESSRGLHKRIQDHKNDIRHHRTSNSLVVHIDSHKHLPNWQGIDIIQKGLSKSIRKTVEAAYINTNETINHRDGFVSLSRITSNLILGSLT